MKMNKTSWMPALAFLLSALLAACETEPVKPESTPPPAAEETPAAGSQAEADAVAEEAAAEQPADAAEAPADEAGATGTATATKPAPKGKAAADTGEPQTHAVATAVLPPAWIYRGDLSTALLPGTAVYEGDRIETGADGRVQLSLDDGGSLQLGGGAKFTATRLHANETSSLDGTLDLDHGSFAFQSGKNGSLLPGDLDFKTGALTAFVTQAALMGRAGDKESLVCLLGGKAEVSRQDQAPVTLDTPKSCVTTLKSTATAAGTAKQLKSLEQDTQPPAGLKAMKSKGTWSLVLVSEGNESKAKAAAAKLWKSGYPAEVIEATVKKKTYYRLALRGFESREAANAFKKRAVSLGYKTAWANGK